MVGQAGFGDGVYQAGGVRNGGPIGNPLSCPFVFLSIVPLLWSVESALATIWAAGPDHRPVAIYCRYWRLANAFPRWRLVGDSREHNQNRGKSTANPLQKLDLRNMIAEKNVGCAAFYSYVWKLF
jgi:hypothetical protein